MTMPVIPVGRAQAAATLAAELAALRQQIAELSRRGLPPTPLTPICRVKLNVNVSLGGGADQFAYGDWIVGEDPDGLFTLGSTNPSKITIQTTGRYLVQTRAVFTSPSGSGTCVAYVTKGAANVNNSIARDPRNTSNAGSDGAVCHATRSVLLTAGDVLYWGHWSSVAATLSTVNINVPTEVSISWLGTR